VKIAAHATRPAHYRRPARRLDTQFPGLMVASFWRPASLNHRSTSPCAPQPAYRTEAHRSLTDADVTASPQHRALIAAHPLSRAAW